MSTESGEELVVRSHCWPNGEIEHTHIKVHSEEPFVFEFDEEWYVELVKIEGWRLQFIPAQGPFAGQPISRVFVVPEGVLGRAKKICRIRYGEATHILAGAALHKQSSFGDWDD